MCALTAALWGPETEDPALFLSLTTEEPPSGGAWLLQPHPQWAEKELTQKEGAST